MRACFTEKFCSFTSPDLTKAIPLPNGLCQKVCALIRHKCMSFHDAETCSTFYIVKLTPAEILNLTGVKHSFRDIGAVSLDAGDEVFRVLVLVCRVGLPNPTNKNRFVPFFSSAGTHSGTSRLSIKTVWHFRLPPKCQLLAFQ